MVFSLQWHITKKCDMDCNICYISSEEKKNSSNNDLTLLESMGVIDDFKGFSLKYGFTPNIVFTGGHPLMDDKFFKLLEYSKENNIRTMVLGNPTLLTDDAIERLVDNGISSYQISFDGLEEKHDAIRGKGAFYKATRGVEKLSKNGVNVVVMSTVTKDNRDDVIELPQYVLDIGARKFDFARLVPTGNGKGMQHLLFTPLEYKGFLTDMHSKYQELISIGYPEESFGIKEHLWKLFFYEKGLFTPSKDSGVIHDGCSVGASGFCMDSDGSLYGCRRLNDVIDNIRETTTEKFFLTNKTMEEYRNVENLTKCGDCELLYDCRGCPAVARNYNESFFDADPQCWKK